MLKQPLANFPTMGNRQARQAQKFGLIREPNKKEVYKPMASLLAASGLHKSPPSFGKNNSSG